MTAPPVRLTIGTRGSALALRQTEIVREELSRHHPWLRVDVLRITTRGDILIDQPLASLGERGLFVSEIEESLRHGRIDLAVHSAKDLPSRLPDDMRIGAWLARADAADALVTMAGRDVWALPSGSRVGTSSPRRSCQLRALRSDLRLLDVRGNVDTRMRKLESGEYDALVLAVAGLDRLGLVDGRVWRFPPDVMIPAPGQGALAIEVTASGTDVAELLAPLDDAVTAAAVVAERAFLAAVAGGCSTASAAFAQVTQDGLVLRAMIGAGDGRLVKGERVGSSDAGVTLARALAEELLQRGGAELLRHADLEEVNHGE
ncbi:MAG: hydroxymethylbilane synthase [Gemmatimonadota bacterium]|nr:hydroxymethylbilane synthase [Gemmatimonadota bacterium]